MTDQLEDLFADLRADTLTRIRPPGAEAVRHTLHRRRTTKSLGAAAFVAVVAGGIGSHLLGPLPSTETGAPDPATLAKRQSRAAGAAGIDPDGQTRPARSAQGVAAAGIVATELLVAGTYTLRLACVGPGRLTALLRVQPAPGVAADLVESSTQRCDAGAAATTTFTLTADATIETELRPDDHAAGRSGYALRLIIADADLRRLAGEAMKRLPVPAESHFASSESWPVQDRDQGLENQTLTPGRYRMHFTCVGAGTMTDKLSVLAGGKSVLTTSGTADCAAGTVTTLAFEIPAGHVSNTMVTMTADADALDQAGYADVFERV